jgi:hypothetical protein
MLPQRRGWDGQTGGQIVMGSEARGDGELGSASLQDTKMGVYLKIMQNEIKWDFN